MGGLRDAIIVYPIYYGSVHLTDDSSASVKNPQLLWCPLRMERKRAGTNMFANIFVDLTNRVWDCLPEVLVMEPSA